MELKKKKNPSTVLQQRHPSTWTSCLLNSNLVLIRAQKKKGGSWRTGHHDTPPCAWRRNNRRGEGGQEERNEGREKRRRWCSAIEYFHTEVNNTRLYPRARGCQPLLFHPRYSLFLARRKIIIIFFPLLLEFQFESITRRWKILIRFDYF